MDIRYLLFIIFIIFIYKNEGFVNIYQKNLNSDDTYPDKNQFYPVHNHNIFRINNEEKTILGNNNYKIVKNSIKEPQDGPFSGFIDANNYRTYNQFYHAPITDKTYGFDVEYKRQYDYKIVQNEDNNKKELLKKEKENDNKISNPNYLYGHPENNSKILYSDELQDMFLKVKNENDRNINNTHSGQGFHGI